MLLCHHDLGFVTRHGRGVQDGLAWQRHGGLKALPPLGPKSSKKKAPLRI